MRPFYLVLIVVCVQGAFGQSNLVIDSIQADESLSWTSDLTNATHCLIEWAPGAAGPWAADWEDLDRLTDIAGPRVKGAAPLGVVARCAPTPNHFCEYAPKCPRFWTFTCFMAAPQTR